MSLRSDIVIGRHGSSTTGNIKNKTFTIVDELAEHTVKKKNIASIQYSNPGFQHKDEIRLLNGDVLVGNVIDDPIILHEHSSDTDLAMHKNQVLAIMFGRELDI